MSDFSIVTLFALLFVEDAELQQMAQQELEKKFGSGCVEKIRNYLEKDDPAMLDLIDIDSIDEHHLKKLKSRLDECKKGEKPFYGTDTCLLEMKQSGDTDMQVKASNMIVLAFDELIHHEIHKQCQSFVHCKDDYDDFYQYGSIGVLTAFEKYNGMIDFPTHAKPYITHELKKQTRFMQGNPVHSHHYSAQQKKVMDAAGDDPDHIYTDQEINEISKKTGLSPKTVRKEIQAKLAANTMSYDDAENAGYNMIDNSESVEETAEKDVLLEKIFEELQKLEETNKGITELVLRNYLDQTPYNQLSREADDGRSPYKIEKEIKEAISTLAFRLNGRPMIE